MQQHFCLFAVQYGRDLMLVATETIIKWSREAERTTWQAAVLDV